MSHDKMQTKAWAVDELAKARKNLGLVYIVGGRFGLLGPLLFAHPKLKIDRVRSFDIDPACELIADQINVEKVIFDWHYKAITKDMLDIDYVQHMYEVNVPGGYFNDKNKFIDHKPMKMCEIPDTIINMSCDHVSEFSKWWEMVPQGKLVLLQNNNFRFGTNEMNTVNAISQMVAQAPMSEIMFSGERDYSKSRCFMLIGVK